jgi:hypothetical protein
MIATVGAHCFDRELAGEEHAAAVDRHHLLPFLGAGLLDSTERDDPGVGDKRVDDAEALDCGSDDPARVLLDGDVAEHGRHLDSIAQVGSGL